MIEHKKLIDYLPPFLAEYREYKRLNASLQKEVNSILEKTENALNDTFVNLATLDGIKRWENMLGIIPSADATIEERRAAIEFKLNTTLPYTFKALKHMLDNLLGADQYWMGMTDVFELTIMIELTSSYMQDTVSTMVAKIIPANIGLRIELRFIQHLTYNDIYKHKELAQYNHEYLRTVGVIEHITEHVISYQTEHGTPPNPIVFKDSYILQEKDLPDLNSNIIEYRTRYGTAPDPIRFKDSYTLKEEDLPELEIEE